MQRLIAQALSIGIGKKELMEDYYPGELASIIAEWNVIHCPEDAEEEKEVGIEEFLKGLM